MLLVVLSFRQEETQNEVYTRFLLTQAEVTRRDSGIRAGARLWRTCQVGGGRPKAMSFSVQIATSHENVCRFVRDIPPELLQVPLSVRILLTWCWTSIEDAGANIGDNFAAPQDWDDPTDLEGILWVRDLVVLGRQTLEIWLDIGSRKTMFTGPMILGKRNHPQVQEPRHRGHQTLTSSQ